MSEKQIDPNEIFGEDYGVDWEYLPNSMDVKVSERGVAFAHSNLDPVPYPHEAFRKRIQVSIHCDTCGAGKFKRSKADLVRDAEADGWTANDKGVFCYRHNPELLSTPAETGSVPPTEG